VICEKQYKSENSGGVIAETRLHDLRNFATVSSIMAGVSVRTISQKLVHANSSTTLLVNSHFIKANDQVWGGTFGGEGNRRDESTYVTYLTTIYRTKQGTLFRSRQCVDARAWFDRDARRHVLLEVRSYHSKRTTKLKHRDGELTSLMQRPGRRPVDPENSGCLSEAHRHRRHGFDGRRVCDTNSTCRYWQCHMCSLLSPASSTLAVRVDETNCPSPCALHVSCNFHQQCRTALHRFIESAG
jgi:hypothetical protein